MERLMRAVYSVIDNNLQHRKGPHAQSLTIPDIFNGLHDESCKFYRAITLDEGRKAELSECGDVLAIVYHIMVKRGLTWEEVEQAALDKLAERWRSHW